MKLKEPKFIKNCSYTRHNIWKSIVHTLEYSVMKSIRESVDNFIEISTTDYIQNYKL